MRLSARAPRPSDAAPSRYPSPPQTTHLYRMSLTPTSRRGWHDGNRWQTCQPCGDPPSGPRALPSRGGSPLCGWIGTRARLPRLRQRRDRRGGTIRRCHGCGAGPVTADAGPQERSASAERAASRALTAAQGWSPRIRSIAERRWSSTAGDKSPSAAEKTASSRSAPAQSSATGSLAISAASSDSISDGRLRCGVVASVTMQTVPARERPPHRDRLDGQTAALSGPTGQTTATPRKHQCWPSTAPVPPASARRARAARARPPCRHG